MRTLLLICATLIVWHNSVSPLEAQGTSDLKIDTQSYALDGQTYIIKNATLNWADITLEAGEVQFNLDTKKLTATHFVRFTDSRIVAILDRLEIDLNTQQGIFHNVTLFDATTQAYLTAKEVHKIDKLHFTAKQCSVTTCDPQAPAWQIKGDEVNYQGENFSSALGATLLVSDIPVFYFPYLLWPTVTERQTGFLAPSYEVFSSTEDKFNLGFKLQIPYFWALSRDQNLTLRTDFIENRGIGTGLEYEYAFREGLRGKWDFWEIRENIERDPAQESGRLEKDEIAGANLRPPRYKFQFNHNQTLGERTQLIFSGQIFSDSQFQREYERIRKPNPNYAQDLNISLSRQFDIGDVGFLIDRELVYEEVALLNQNFIETRVQRLPEISFHYSDNPWAIPLTLEMDSVVTRFHRDSGVIGWRQIVIPRFRYRFSPIAGINAIVSRGKRLSYYQVYNPGDTVFYEDQAVAVASRQRRNFAYEIDLTDAEVNTTLSRVIIPETGVFSRFKHLITPRLLFEATEDVNQDETRSLVLPTVSNPNPDSVDFFDKEDKMPGKQLVIFRLDNLLLAKKYLSERTVTLTENSLKRLKSRLSENVFKRLEKLTNQHFFSEATFLLELETLLNNKLTPEQERLILSYVQKGVHRRAENLEESKQESPSWVLSRLHIIQRFNLLRRYKNYDPKGPQIKDQETTEGEPLLPLQIEWNLSPGPEFSLDFFLRYSYQASRIVESKATFKVQMNANNQAQIRFHNNETSYRTPDNVFHEKTNTLSFESVFDASDTLSFGFGGKFNLNVSDKNALRRRLIEDSFFLNYHPKCYVVSLVLKELAERTVTSGGKQKEITDPSIALTISLGQVLPLPQQKFQF